MSKMNVAIDGPAGAGKSTIAKKVAKALSYIYVDTGAMYRAMALFLIKNNISPDNNDAIEECCERAEITIKYVNGEQRVILNGEDVTGSLRTEEVGNMASASSKNGKVREKLVRLQQELAASTEVVMDGRDIGTVVLPDAPVKVYLTASAHTRALRRKSEYGDDPKSPSLEQIEADIIERDERDMNREISPLKQADDAILIDSSEMGIDEVTNAILELVRAK